MEAHHGLLSHLAEQLYQIDSLPIVDEVEEALGVSFLEKPRFLLMTKRNMLASVLQLDPAGCVGKAVIATLLATHPLSFFSLKETERYSYQANAIFYTPEDARDTLGFATTFAYYIQQTVHLGQDKNFSFLAHQFTPSGEKIHMLDVQKATVIDTLGKGIAHWGAMRTELHPYTQSSEVPSTLTEQLLTILPPGSYQQAMQYLEPYSAGWQKGINVGKVNPTAMDFTLIAREQKLVGSFFVAQVVLVFQDQEKTAVDAIDALILHPPESLYDLAHPEEYYERITREP